MHKDTYAVQVDIEWDPAKAVTNLRRHRVRLADTATVFDDPLLQTRPDPDAEGEARFVSLGRGAMGVVLVVVWTERNDVIRLVSARKASPGEPRRAPARPSD